VESRNDNEKKKDHREISYQVGWKKGKIQWNEGATDTLRGHRGVSDDGATERKRLKLLWIPAMKLPQVMVLPLLYALPVVSFGCTLLLIYGLRQR
jgi:hypothetical protein